METAEEEDDLKLAKASARLLSDLDNSLSRSLYRSHASEGVRGKVHSRVRQRDLDHVIKLIEPFQGEPQLLDTRLKFVLPPIVEAFLQYLLLDRRPDVREDVDMQNALARILYTLCKVRGRKVIVGFLNNEPRYLELILGTLETTSPNHRTWQLEYVLLLWLSHLLLTPFDLASISLDQKPVEAVHGLRFKTGIPHVASRIVSLGLYYLESSTLSQEAAAAMLIRLSIRPDMQKLGIGDALVEFSLSRVTMTVTATQVDIYPQLGHMRFLTGITRSSDLDHLIPHVYRACDKLSSEESGSLLVANAVGRKLILKIYRNVTILALRSTANSGPFQEFVEASFSLEDVIDHLIVSTGDRDTPIRYAAAKAIGMILLVLYPSFAHEVIDAILQIFKEDLIPSANDSGLDSTNALRWHGLTLALAHALFKRSVSVEQLADTLLALLAALNFEQRTATGSSVGTNVRDAANFGIWSLSRRYTTKALLAVDVNAIQSDYWLSRPESVIQALAIRLLQSACLDPAGNIRRGSSAALQELVGRHPNLVYEGITLVQIVDYQAVGLRRRAMIDVASKAASLRMMYWEGLVNGMVGWRGLGSTDVSSRDAAAASIATCAGMRHTETFLPASSQLIAGLRKCSDSDSETLHGLILALAIVVEQVQLDICDHTDRLKYVEIFRAIWTTIDHGTILDMNFNARILRAELPVAIARLAAALSRQRLKCDDVQGSGIVDLTRLGPLAERLLMRSEKSALNVIPLLVTRMVQLADSMGAPCEVINIDRLATSITAESFKPTLPGAGKAFALAALVSCRGTSNAHKQANVAFDALARLCSANSVDWRILAFRAMRVALDDDEHSVDNTSHLQADIRRLVVDTIHSGLNDHTIDERGDIGSLVRLQAIASAKILATGAHASDLGEDDVRILHSDVLRLSLEKLNRVRLQAAQCRQMLTGTPYELSHFPDVDSEEYVSDALAPLWNPDMPDWVQHALLEGLVSCAGVASEELLVTARQVLANELSTLSKDHLLHLMKFFAQIVKDALVHTINLHAGLELLAFLLDVKIPQRLVETDFKWRNLLSTVQKAHYKSTDIPKILAAVHVYIGLADVQIIREEVLKKLFSMLRTHPYPKIRASVADALFVVTREETLKGRDWGRPASQQADCLATLQKRYLT